MTKEDSILLTATTRVQGKHNSRLLRRSKQTPAVVYGPKIDSLNFSISEIDADRYTKSQYENTIFILKSDDSKLNKLKVLKKALVRHPASRRPVHLDFYALDMTQTVRVNVEIRFSEGKSAGEIEGGVRQELRRDVEVECLPTEIPDFFEIDITDLELGGTVHASAITLPDGVKLMTNDTEAVITIAQPAEEEPEPVAAAADGEAAPAGAGEAAADPAAAGDDKKES